MIGKLETVLWHAVKAPGKTPEHKKLKLISGVTNVTALILLLKPVANRIAEVYEMFFPWSQLLVYLSFWITIGQSIWDAISLGNKKCEPGSPEWTGYSERCCTISNPCSARQGGCNSDEQCTGGANLVCSDAGCGTDFATGEKCCRVKGNANMVQGGQLFVPVLSKDDI